MSVVYGAAAHFGAKPLWEVYEYEKRDICLPAIQGCVGGDTSLITVTFQRCSRDADGLVCTSGAYDFSLSQA